MENNIGERKQNVTTAESKVVGMVLKNPQYMQDFHQKLTYDVFSIDSHKTIYKVMGNLFNESLEPDFDLVRTALQSSNLLDSVGGIDYLNHLKELPTETDFKNKSSADGKAEKPAANSSDSESADKKAAPAAASKSDSSGSSTASAA